MTEPSELRIVDPATGKELTRLRCCDERDVEDARRRAREVQPEWSRRSFDHRLAALDRFRALLLERCDELAALLTDEMGKPISQARAEIRATADRVAYFVTETPELIAPQVVHCEPGLVERITRDPLGVVAHVSAWNYPYFVGCNVLVPALLAGTAVLYKPSEYASLSGRAIVALLHEAGVPRDLAIWLPGAGATGAALVGLVHAHSVSQPGSAQSVSRIDGVFFTGSYATGRAISEHAAGALIPVQLELGGVDPVYVCEDADISVAAASVAEGAFYNTGQSCCAVERVYVHRLVYAEFVEAFVARVQEFACGDPRDPTTYLGPLTRPQQVSHLEAQLTDAVQKGARIVCGGTRRPGPGNFFEATVAVDVSSSMSLMRQESFGPVIGIEGVRDDVEAVDRMNDTDYGLTAGIYSTDEARATALLAELDTGSAYWNCCDRVSPRLPWSGRRRSGLGTTLSHDGIRCFTKPRAWHLRYPPVA